jgi:hypothetical protein
MAKDSKTSKKNAPKEWIPGRGPPPKGDKTRSARLLIRVHPDLLPLVDVHAAERGITRSQLVEQVLVGFLRLDPRAPRISAIGQLEPLPEGTPPPIPTRPGAFPRPAVPPNPHLFLRRWDDFRKASELVTGYVPLDTLVEDYVSMGPTDEPDDYGKPAADRWSRKPR